MAKPSAKLCLEKGKDGAVKQCLTINAAMEQQMHDTEEETDFDRDFFTTDREADKEGYITPTESDYELSDVKDIIVRDTKIKDFRDEGSRHKMLGKDLPRYKHSLRVATPQPTIPLPQIFTRVKDHSVFCSLDSTSADTEAYESGDEEEV